MAEDEELDDDDELDDGVDDAPVIDELDIRPPHFYM